MSSSNNDITEWTDHQLHEKDDDDDDDLHERKSTERRRHAKARKEEAMQKAEEKARRKAEQEARRKAEVEARKRAKADAKAQSAVAGPSKGKQRNVAGPTATLARCYGCSDAEVACEMKVAEGSRVRRCDCCRRLRHKCERLGDMPPTRRRKRAESMAPREGKKKARTKSPLTEEEEDEERGGDENRDTLGALAEVLALVVEEMQTMAAERRAHTERMMGTLEEIRDCLDANFKPEEGSDDGSEDRLEDRLEDGLEDSSDSSEEAEAEAAEVAEEKEALKGQNREEAEVDESV
ncbi:hypothetical protein PAXRUDRAFT_22378 [Paxillus rubicundulus Ve08.2h10]|uniref:Uncharacterized protein n=1 Tax=Paxillus rubicundulus Ve08.2h10 TaxID=930991 RepID=A0A0D0BKC2_9AGAM|nr:hypothetical protein PAXRUDRAFT_22378 [Paxillus rubicundulus Ve08.2h10]